MNLLTARHKVIQLAIIVALAALFVPSTATAGDDLVVYFDTPQIKGFGLLHGKIDVAKMDLNDDQERAIRKVKRQHTGKIDRLRKTVERENTALERAIKKGPFDEAAVKKQLEKVLEAEKQLKLEQAKLRVGILQQLENDQVGRILDIDDVQIRRAPASDDGDSSIRKRRLRR